MPHPLSHNLETLHTTIERFIDRLGKVICWFTLVMVILMTLIVLLRYGFNIGWIAMQESVIYLHATVFMLGIAYTLKEDEHVRVDIFYQRFSVKNKAWVDLLGGVLVLFPVCMCLFYFSFEYVMASWQLFEESGEAGGIPGVFLLKTLILLMPALLMLQGVATIAKQILILTDGSNNSSNNASSNTSNDTSNDSANDTSKAII
ncbi:MAG: TRAP-type mannitol/chloroaromatic compound transport system permease small subunit [Phenylobacterium sp.]|jgi:TRAP-type mannitol/chloroaromatic compound transport system permease small subunit